MSTRAPIALLVLCAVAVVGAVNWWLSPSSATADAVADPVTHVDEALPPARRAAHAETSAPSGPLKQLAPLDDDGGLANDELFAHLSDPANSDLPPELFAELSKLGAAVVRADATGIGREQWPEYWDRVPAPRADPCCSEIVVHAASATTDLSRDGVAQVMVLWKGGAAPVENERVSFVHLQRTPAGWEPVAVRTDLRTIDLSQTSSAPGAVVRRALRSRIVVMKRGTGAQVA